MYALLADTYRAAAPDAKRKYVFQRFCQTGLRAPGYHGIRPSRDLFGIPTARAPDWRLLYVERDDLSGKRRRAHEVDLAPRDREARRRGSWTPRSEEPVRELGSSPTEDGGCGRAARRIRPHLFRRYNLGPHVSFQRRSKSRSMSAAMRSRCRLRSLPAERNRRPSMRNSRPIRIILAWVSSLSRS